MFNDGTPIAVVGPGAVGGLIAALLHRHGANVVAVARAGTARAISSEGLTIHSALLGDWTAHVPVQESVPAGARVILAVKAFALPQTVPALAAAEPVEIISLLNGVEHMDHLRRAFPGTTLLGGAITVEAARKSTTVVEHRSPFIKIAVPEAGATSAVVQALDQAGVEVATGGSGPAVLWTKLRFLAPLALLTAYWDAPLGSALGRDEQLRARLIEEISSVATAEGLPTGPAELSKILATLPPAMRSSLQSDLSAGRESEIEAIGGAIIRRAQEHGLPVPTTIKVVTDLRHRQTGQPQTR